MPEIIRNNSTGKGAVVVSVSKELDALCNLPKSLRSALDYADFNYSTQETLKLYEKAKKLMPSEDAEQAVMRFLKKQDIIYAGIV